jgi:hypothetical protein
MILRSNNKLLEDSVTPSLHRMNCAFRDGNWPILRFGNCCDRLLKEEKVKIAVASPLLEGRGRRTLNEEGILGEGMQSTGQVEGVVKEQGETA